VIPVAPWYIHIRWERKLLDGCGRSRRGRLVQLFDHEMGVGGIALLYLLPTRRCDAVAWRRWRPRWYSQWNGLVCDIHVVVLDAVPIRVGVSRRGVPLSAGQRRSPFQGAAASWWK